MATVFVIMGTLYGVMFVHPAQILFLAIKAHRKPQHQHTASHTAHTHIYLHALLIILIEGSLVFLQCKCASPLYYTLLHTEASQYCQIFLHRSHAHVFALGRVRFIAHMLNPSLPRFSSYLALLPHLPHDMVPL